MGHITYKGLRLCALAVATMLVGTSGANAAVLYATPGATITENFNSLPNTPENTNLEVLASPMKWADDSAPSTGVIGIPGWYLYHPLTQTEGGTNQHQRMRIGAGTANTGSFMSFGATGSTDRALGDVGANTLAAASSDMYIGVRITNNTGQTLGSITVGYAGEQWRDGGLVTPIAQTMTVAYSLTATSISDLPASFTSFGAGFDFSSPVFTNTGSGAAVDGNGVGRTVMGPVTVSNLNWLPGTDLWIRWTDINNPNNDHGLAIDDFSFSATAVPEPATMGLVALGGLALVGRRARRD